MSVTMNHHSCWLSNAHASFKQPVQNLETVFKFYLQSKVSYNFSMLHKLLEQKGKNPTYFGCSHNKIVLQNLQEVYGMVGRYTTVTFDRWRTWLDKKILLLKKEESKKLHPQSQTTLKLHGSRSGRALRGTTKAKFSLVRLITPGILYRHQTGTGTQDGDQEQELHIAAANLLTTLLWLTVRIDFSLIAHSYIKLVP